MLVKTGTQNKNGKELYRNALTGKVSTLGDATFLPSARRSIRHGVDNPKFNNRKLHGEIFTQLIPILNDEQVIQKTADGIKRFLKKNKHVFTFKKVLHYTYASLKRKSANEAKI
ncbi:MAG: hypothetical protein LLF95_12265 [Bacteroidales bacterium]|nr:hypothetical protein [Bacteroidales bacterium]